MGKKRRAKTPPKRLHLLPKETRSKEFLETLDRWAYRKDNTADYADYLALNTNIPHAKLKRLYECGNYLKFGFWDQTLIPGAKLLGGNLCKNHRLCSNCASRRSALNSAILTEKIIYLLDRYPGYKIVFTTITVKNGKDLIERFRHLMNCYKRLEKRRKNAKQGLTNSIRERFLGGYFSVDIAWDPKTSWHPHLHGIEIIPRGLKASTYDTHLEQEWNEITKDSFITRVKEIDLNQKGGLVQAALEVCKYSMKQANMTPAKKFEAYCATDRKQLTRSFGVLSAFKFDDNYERDSILQLMRDNPYMELILKYIQGRYVLDSYLQKEGYKPDHEMNAKTLTPLDEWWENEGKHLAAKIKSSGGKI